MNNYDDQYRGNCWDRPENNPEYWERCIDLTDHGPEPYVLNIEKAAEQNDYFRRALWTGRHLQLTVMSINPGDDIGLEIHPNSDQFISIEKGQALVLMGDSRNNLYFRQMAFEDYGVFIPAGKWHNIINTGCVPLKIYTVYAPPLHPYGVAQRTKEDEEMENRY
ncbi:MAG: cupin domain-containing protein [Tissierellaceae bacterium]|nr:cupin domain-containing protein [Tissierellaceae bacterium]